ncbi:MAG: adenosine deaminase [Oscillospiraceae bacterium]|nr:adenosine deaminase [Oscillospiraceae bacterium]
MMRFGCFYLDREKDIIVDLFMEKEELRYVLRTPNHNTGNLITNLARLCELPLDFDEQGLKVIRGTVPCYVDGDNRRLYIFRMGNTKIANIFPDGSVELKASIPAIAKALMSQTKDYRLSVAKTIVKTYIFDDCKFRTDLHTHMSGNLEPDVLIALGIQHQIRYPLYYIKKLGLRCSEAQREALARDRAAAEKALETSPLTGKYRDRKIDDNTAINFADLILKNPADAAYNIARIRISLAVPKDGQAVFADLEKVYLYRYVFTKGKAFERPLPDADRLLPPDEDVAAILRQMRRDRQSADYRNNTLFQDKLLWIARGYARHGVDYAEISDTSLTKNDQAPEVLRQIHAVMPAITRETGVLLRFLAAIRRTPLTIVRDAVTPNDYLAENLQVIRAVAADPYVAGSDVVGEEINDILSLRGVIRRLVEIAAAEPGFVLRFHAGENDSLRNNVANCLRCVRESLAPEQKMPPIRIGHGLYTCDLRSRQGRRLIRELREQGIVLEFQLTSNVRLNNLSDLSQHPLKKYLREGIRCVQGSDGGALYGTNSIDEELALEKLLGLSREELRQMRETEAEIAHESRRVFEEKSARFAALLDGTGVDALLRRRIDETARVDGELWREGDRLDARTALSDQLAPLPETGFPLVLAGGSFNNDSHQTRVSAQGKQVIDELLREGDPETLFFVVGHRLTGYERYLVEQNKGRFPVYAIVPRTISRAERDRLRRSGLRVILAIEPGGQGIYKSFSYEIFKRRASLLLAFDGNSPAANLVQEAKNARHPCAIYLDGSSRALLAKARTLQGYVRVFSAEDKDLAREILESIRTMR